MATTQQVILTVVQASSTPLIGTANADGNSAAFTPQLGRDMYLTLSGTWTGTVQVQRSTDDGASWNNITVGGGNVWGRFTTNCDEVIDHPTDGNATYRLNIDIATGTVAYRLAQ